MSTEVNPNKSSRSSLIKAALIIAAITGVYILIKDPAEVPETPPAETTQATTTEPTPENQYLAVSLDSIRATYERMGLAYRTDYHGEDDTAHIFTGQSDGLKYEVKAQVIGSKVYSVQVLVNTNDIHAMPNAESFLVATAQTIGGTGLSEWMRTNWTVEGAETVTAGVWTLVKGSGRVSCWLWFYAPRKK